MTPQQNTAIQQIAPIAVRLQAATTLPAFLLIGQVCLESSFLTHAPGNNALGVKFYSGAFGKQLQETWERFTPGEAAQFESDPTNGQKIVWKGPLEEDGKSPCRVLDWFAVFESLADCCAWRARRWMNGSHLPWVIEYFKNPDDPAAMKRLAYCVAVGYATAKPQIYADSVIAIGDSAEARAAILEAGKLGTT